MTDFSKYTKQQLIDKLNAGQVPNTNDRLSDHEVELRKVSRLSNQSNPNKIPFYETSDHKNIMLYTAVNKKVGPLHPDNAKRTMERWKAAGIQLYTTKRTDEQVEAFKKTPQWLQWEAKHKSTRKSRKAQSSKGKTEKMIVDIAAAVAGANKGANNG